MLGMWPVLTCFSKASSVTTLHVHFKYPKQYHGYFHLRDDVCRFTSPWKEHAYCRFVWSSLIVVANPVVNFSWYSVGLIKIYIHSVWLDQRRAHIIYSGVIYTSTFLVQYITSRHGPSFAPCFGCTMFVQEERMLAVVQDQERWAFSCRFVGSSRQMICHQA